MDKRKNKPGTDSEVVAESGAAEVAPSAPFTQSVFEGSHSSAKSGSPDASGVGDTSIREEASSTEEVESRFVDAGLASEGPDAPQPDAGGATSAAVEGLDQVEEAHDYLDDLRRLQAEFDNFRKRTFKERQGLEARGKRMMVEQLLPVLDNFERAIAHGEGGGGVELVFKELKSTLEREGLEEIAAEGRPFDPQVHEAVESVEDADVQQPTVTSVYRRGYAFAGEVVRPAMVVVARPVEVPVESAEVAEGGA